MLDTDMASYVIKGRSPEVASRLAEIPPSTVCVSVMTRAELMYGLKLLPEGHRLQLGVRRFLRLVRVLAWDSDAADYYAEIRYQLVASGQPIGELDMMIAAHSLSVGATLVTNNMRHYARITAPLTVVNWTGTT
jgi:tRNA(fMet)-specific endonuclease VapC